MYLCVRVDLDDSVQNTKKHKCGHVVYVWLLCLFVYIYVHIYIYIYIYMYVCMYVSMYDSYIHAHLSHV